MDYLDDLLSGLDRLDDVLAQRSFLYAAQEVARDLVVDVGLEQDSTDLSQTVPNHGLREDPSLPELAEYPIQLVAQLFEHRRPRLPVARPWDYAALRSRPEPGG